MRRAHLRLGLIAAVSALTILSGLLPVSAEEPANPPGMNYLDLEDKLSQPIYPNIVTEAVDLEMSDGETIYIEVTRPDPDEYGEGPWPVVMEASPYHGTIATRIGDRIFPDPRQGNKNLGLTGYFAPRGYAVVMMDLRGTGRSTGCLDHLGPKDGSDLKESVEWAASQPWSNGRVGMTGHSYVGSTPNLAAAMRPEGLVTIAPSAGLASMYDHQFNKGVPWNLQWVGPMVAYEGLALVRDLPPGFTEPVLTGAPTGDNYGYRGPNTQTGCGMQNSAAISGSGQVTGQYELWHARRDWRAGATDADIPVFMIHGVNDNAARIPAAEWFFTGRYDRPGDKVWIGQWDHGSTNGICGNTSNARVSHPNCRFDQWVKALHAWFDHHLAQRTYVDEDGIERLVPTGPPVEVFLNGVFPWPVNQVRDPEKKDGRVFTSDVWRKYPKVELSPDATDMSLDFGEPESNGSASFAATTDAVLAHVGGDLEFTSAPASEDMLFVGMPRLDLRASVSTSQIVHLTATLWRIDTGGTRSQMGYCAIQPMLRSGVTALDPVIPGQVMDLPMQCFTMAHWLPKGHRMALEFDTDTPHHATFGSEAQITVHTGPDETRYFLPKVDDFTIHPDVPLRAS